MIDLKANPFFLSDEQVNWVHVTLASMTDEEKLGQLFCLMGQDYPMAQMAQMVRHGKVGGILYRPEPEQSIRDRWAMLDPLARIPLLKAANLEEGSAGAITDGTLFGWPMLTAATDDESFAVKFGTVCGSEGRSAGINWTFSPVSDIDMNPLNPITNVRTFGSDPERIRRMTGAYVDAVQSCGVAACAKHFPGDGVDYRDQHLHPTYNSLSAREWYDTYGTIYRNLIDRHHLLSIMVGHIVQPNVEMDINPSLQFADCLPGSLSPELLTGVLRGKFGFNGVITTDATIMGGFCQAMARCDAIPAAIMAGNDMLVFSTDIEEDFGYLQAALSDRRLTHERLNEAVTRIMALKAKVCFQPECKVASCGAEWHREAAEKAITLVKDTSSALLPVTPEKYPVIRLICLGKDDIPDGSVRAIVTEWLQNAGFSVESYDPLADDLHGTSALSDRRLTLYIMNHEHASNQTTVRIDWSKKHALDMPRFVHEEPCVMVSLANPYLLQDSPRIPVYINAYTATRTVIETVLNKLLCGGPFTGISPVDAYCGLPDARL